MIKLLTLGIPTFNDCENLVQGLDHIKKNDLTAVEVVIVDNASTDATPKTIAAYKALNPDMDIRYFRNENNIGGVKNLFEVAKYARGQFLWFVCDDLLCSDAIKNFKRIIWDVRDLDILQVGVCEFSGDPKNILWCHKKRKIEVVENFKKRNLGFSNFVGNIIMKTQTWRGFSDEERCTNNLYPHLWIAMRIFKESRTIFAYDTCYIMARATRNYDGTPLRSLKEITLNSLKCLNENKKFLGGTIFDSIMGENHFKRLENMLIKFLYKHMVEPQRQYLKTIPTSEKFRIFWQLICVSKFRRKQIKFLIKIGFYLFQSGAVKLSDKDWEYLKFGDKANASNSKLILQ